MRRIPRILTLSPGGVLGARAAVAGSRSGALGVLDLGSGVVDREAHEAVDRVGRLLKDRSFGVRLDGEALGGALLGRAPSNLGVVVVSDGGRVDWKRARLAIQS